MSDSVAFKLLFLNRFIIFLMECVERFMNHKSMKLLNNFFSYNVNSSFFFIRLKVIDQNTIYVKAHPTKTDKINILKIQDGE